MKEALFSIIQNYIYNSKVLDLFAGSGALALESLSRGADKAILCDSSKKAVQIIKTNIEKTHFEAETEIINKDYKRVLEEFKNEKFDIIFLDPPYETNFGIEAIDFIIKNNMIEKEGIIVFETDREDEYINYANASAKVIDIRKYGRIKLVFLGRKE